jgi:hypothetical protein
MTPPNNPIPLEEAVERLTDFADYLKVRRSETTYRNMETDLRTIINALPDEEMVARAIEALTPSGDTKAAYHGEFHFTLTRIDEAGDEYFERVYVPWDTTKEIMAAIRTRAAISTLYKGVK